MDLLRFVKTIQQLNRLTLSLRMADAFLSGDFEVDQFVIWTIRSQVVWACKLLVLRWMGEGSSCHHQYIYLPVFTLAAYVFNPTSGLVSWSLNSCLHASWCGSVCLAWQSQQATKASPVHPRGETCCYGGSASQQLHQVKCGGWSEITFPQCFELHCRNGWKGWGNYKMCTLKC